MLCDLLHLDGVKIVSFTLRAITKFSGCLNYLTCAEGDTYETAFFLLYCRLLRFSFFVFMLCDAWIYTGFIQSQNNWL